jgi:hypothetical protein
MWLIEPPQLQAIKGQPIASMSSLHHCLGGAVGKAVYMTISPSNVPPLDADAQ